MPKLDLEQLDTEGLQKLKAEFDDMEPRESNTNNEEDVEGGENFQQRERMEKGTK